MRRCLQQVQPYCERWSTLLTTTGHIVCNARRGRDARAAQGVTPLSRAQIVAPAWMLNLGLSLMWTTR